MKKRIISNLSFSFLLVSGVLCLVLYLLGFKNINVLFLLVMSSFGICELITYISSFKHECFITGSGTLLNCWLALLLLFINEPLAISFAIITWMALIIFIKIFNFKKNWEIYLFIFLTLGIFASINLFYRSNIHFLILGLYFCGVGLLAVSIDS